METSVTIYKNTRYSSNGYPPIKVFIYNDYKSFNITKKSIVKKQKYKMKPEMQLNNRKTLICENFALAVIWKFQNLDTVTKI